MSHGEWRDLLSPYLDGELGAAEAGRVSSHVAACGQCRAALDRMLALSLSLRALPRHAMPGEMKEALRRAAATEQIRSDRSRTLGFGWPLKAAASLTGAAALLAIALLLHPQPAPTPPAAASSTLEEPPADRVASLPATPPRVPAASIRADEPRTMVETARPAQPAPSPARRPKTTLKHHQAPPPGRGPAPVETRQEDRYAANDALALKDQASGRAAAREGVEGPPSAGALTVIPPAATPATIAATPTRGPIVARYASDLILGNAGEISLGPMVPLTPVSAPSAQARVNESPTASPSGEPSARARPAEPRTSAESVPTVRFLRREAKAVSGGEAKGDSSAARTTTAPDETPDGSAIWRSLDQLRGRGDLRVTFLIRSDAAGRIQSAEPIGAPAVGEELTRAIAAVLVGSLIEPHDPGDPPLVSLEVRIPPIP